jgi:hypothetical protein
MGPLSWEIPGPNVPVMGSDFGLDFDAKRRQNFVFSEHRARVHSWGITLWGQTFNW